MTAASLPPRPSHGRARRLWRPRSACRWRFHPPREHGRRSGSIAGPQRGADDQTGPPTAGAAGPDLQRRLPRRGLRQRVHQCALRRAFPQQRAKRLPDARRVPERAQYAPATVRCGAARATGPTAPRHARRGGHAHAELNCVRVCRQRGPPRGQRCGPAAQRSWRRPHPPRPRRPSPQSGTGRWPSASESCSSKQSSPAASTPRTVRVVRGTATVASQSPPPSPPLPPPAFLVPPPPTTHHPRLRPQRPTPWRSTSGTSVAYPGTSSLPSPRAPPAARCSCARRPG